MSVLSLREIKEAYPALEYQNKTQKAKQYPIHYLLAYGLSEERIVHYINSLQGGRLSLLSRADDSFHSLNALHLATIMKKVEVVAAILAKSTDHIDQTDAYQWTALHHAAVVSDSIFKLLKLKRANENAHTRMRGTPRDLRLLMVKELKTRSLETTFLQEGDSMRPLSSLSEQDRNEKLRLELYRDTAVVHRKFLNCFWRQVKINPEFSEFDCFYPRYLAQRLPKLIIRPCIKLEGVTTRALELVAGERLEPEAIIGEYGGSFHNRKLERISFATAFTEEENLEYVCNLVDAQKVGNCTRFANWGFPNACFGAVTANGIERTLLIATRIIEEGEPILLDYGISETKLAFGEPQVIMGHDKMLAFFERGLDFEINIFQTPGRSVLDQNYRGMNLRFPLSCPSALIDLHFRGIVKAQKWDEKFHHEEMPRFIEEWMFNNSNTSWFVRAMINRLIDFDSKGSEDVKERAKNWVLASIGKLSAMKILKGLDLFLSNGSIDAFDFETYNWLEDEEAPLSVNRVRVDILKEFDIFEDPMQAIAAANKNLKLARKYPGSDLCDMMEWVTDQLVERLPNQVYKNTVRRVFIEL